MKTCVKCNLSYDDSKKFCKKCGNPLVLDIQIAPKEVAKKTVYEDRLKADPLNTEILHEYAQFLFNNLLFKEAITISLKILAINENDGLAKELLFKSYIKLKLFKDASEIGKQLHSEKPKDIFLLEELARISTELNDSDKATEYYDIILSLQPSNANALYSKAQILLKKNQLEKAIEVFKKIYKEGQKDRVTSIYVGIDMALNGDYTSAINLLTPILSDEKISQKDLDNTRGFLYLAYSLCQNKVEVLKIAQWISKIHLSVLKNDYHAFDEQALAKTIFYIIEYELSKITSSTNVKSQTQYLESKYLGQFYFTEITYPIFAEIWFNIAIKQIEFGFHSEALISCAKAKNMLPDEKKYINKYAEINKVFNHNIRKQKQKKTITIGTFIVFVIVIFVLFFFYKDYKENQTWFLTKQTNTVASYEQYIITHQDGKYLTQAKELYEEALWKSILKTNNAMAYDEYISTFINGKYIIEAKNALKKTNGYSIKFTINHLENSITLKDIRINSDNTEVVIFSSSNGSIHEPNSNYAFFIRDNESNKIYNLKSASVVFNVSIPAYTIVHIYFDKIPFQTKNIGIIEGNCRERCWHMYGINLIRDPIIRQINFFR